MQLMGASRSTRKYLWPKDSLRIEVMGYEEAFAPVARYSSIKSILPLVMHKGWKKNQTDVKAAFVNGVIEEEIYIEQPKGLETYDLKSHVCKLKKVLYGQK